MATRTDIAGMSATAPVAAALPIAALDAEMAQEISRVAGILGCDDVHGAQDFNGPGGHVPEIADGGCNEVKHGRGGYQPSLR